MYTYTSIKTHFELESILQPVKTVKLTDCGIHIFNLQFI